MNNGAGKNNWVGVLIILGIIIGAFFFASSRKEDLVTGAPKVVDSKNISNLTLFREGLSAAGITADTIGFHGFSPDGTYFFLSAFRDGAQPANQAYLVKIADGTVTKLPGLAEAGIEDNRVITLYNPSGTTLYFLATGESKTYDLGENVFRGSLSPDGKTYVANTLEGLRTVDIATGVITTLTTDQYDGAYAWFSDSNRILGFEGTDEKLTDGAGNVRRIGIWDISKGVFTPITTSITAKTMRSISWVVQDRIARINTGFDDGSHDYLYNTQTNAVIDLGDTSGTLMGGVTIDAKRGLIAVVGGDDQSPSGSRVVVYDGMTKKHDLVLMKGYFRQNVHIVNEDTLMYLRKQYGEQGITAHSLVKLDLDTEKEIVLRELPITAYTALSLSSDKKTWVLSQDNQFFTGTL